MTKLLVGAYLLAIIAANLAVYYWGPWVTPYTAFLLIGLDLTTRDRLQDLFAGHRRVKMAGMILAGSVGAYIVNPAAQRIAVASAVAFAGASLIDWTVYAVLRGRDVPWLARANGSNLFGAAVDSALFPTLAFGVWLWPIVFAQFTAKVAGGMLWSMVVEVRNRRVASDS